MGRWAGDARYPNHAMSPLFQLLPSRVPMHAGVEPSRPGRTGCLVRPAASAAAVWWESRWAALRARTWVGVLPLRVAVAWLTATVVVTATAAEPLGEGEIAPFQLPLPGAVGDASYATVRSGALPKLQQHFERALAREGLVRANDRFDCNHYVGLFIALAQARWSTDNWHTRGAAQSLALAEVWYWRGGPGSGQAHAVVAAATDQGLLYFEPQTGQRLELTMPERASIFFVKW